MRSGKSITRNLGAAWLYFYIHFATEVICFFSLTRLTGDSVWLWVAPFVYDALAFVPQGIVGRISDRFPKIPVSVIGIVLMALAGADFALGILPGKYTALVILCLGNVCTHVNGAEVTLRCSDGRLSHSAIFVSGGSFGVITGRLLADTFLPAWVVSLFVLTAIPFAMLAEYYRKDADKLENPCEKFNYNNPKIPAGIVILTATLIVIVRGYMGYGIPTSWKKTVFQTVLLYVTMGCGKALGGVFADLFGVRKTAVFSMVCALPFLFAGDNIMTVSLIGVMFFSMTMSITLALIVSVLQKSPGLAFGFTTTGLFLGTAPIFFFKFTTAFANCAVIAILTVLCLAGVLIITRKDGKKNEQL